jgi:CBS-domain-containing membrane protein
MARHRVRRLAVVDHGRNLVGMLSVADIARRSRPAGSSNTALDSEHVLSMLAQLRSRELHRIVQMFCSGCVDRDAEEPYSS